MNTTSSTSGIKKAECKEGVFKTIGEFETTDKNLAEIDTQYVRNEKLRIKVTSQCNMDCWFCHSEGTLASKDIVPDNNLRIALRGFHDIFNRVHITGGEPMLYAHLESLLDIMSEEGYKASITSNGCFTINSSIQSILSKLDYINISFHSLEPDYYSALSCSESGKIIVDKIIKNIEYLQGVLPVRINTVVSGNGERQHLGKMIQFATKAKCELKFVPELKTKTISVATIEKLLHDFGFTMYQKRYIVPSSNLRERYKDSSGHIIEVKKLTPCFPDCICGDCQYAEICEKGFSFLRFGGDPLYCQACINKSPLSYSNFMKSQWPQLKKEFEAV